MLRESKAAKILEQALKMVEPIYYHFRHRTHLQVLQLHQAELVHAPVNTRNIL